MPAPHQQQTALKMIPTHAHTHTRTHAHTHARTHARTNAPPALQTMFSQFFCAADRNPRIVAWAGALVVVAHAAVHGWVKFALNRWYRFFYDLLEQSGALAAAGNATTDAEWLAHQAAVSSGLLDFGKIALVAVVVMPLAKFVRSSWALRWRLALMRAYVLAWNPNRAPIEGASQRVHEDSYRFSKGVELCVTTLLDTLVTLLVFVPVLLNLGRETSCPASVSALAPLGDAWLLGLATSSALVGLLGTLVLGHRLVGLEVENQVVEAKLRKDLVILETTPSEICLEHNGGFLSDDSVASDVTDAGNSGDPTDAVVTSASLASPFAHFVPIFKSIKSNYHRLFVNFTVLNLFLAIFDQVNVVLPYALFAPLLFSPVAETRIMLGTLIQLSNSFDKVFSSLSVVAENWAGINEFRSVLRRLSQFERAVFPRPKRRTTLSERSLVTTHNSIFGLPRVSKVSGMSAVSGVSAVSAVSALPVEVVSGTELSTTRV